MASLHNFLAEKGYQRVKLHKTKSKHYVVHMKVNAVEGRFIVDTGASDTCIDLQQASRFYLQSEVCKQKAASASSTSLTTQLSKENSIEMGSWVVNNRPIILFMMGAVNEAFRSQNIEEVQGIIGADLLKKAKAVIDYNKSWLYLK